MRGGAQLCSIFRVPIAIVSLVDTDRQWFKSIQGLPVSETSRKASFCAWTLLPACPTVLLVPDARLDERRAPLCSHFLSLPPLNWLELHLRGQFSGRDTRLDERRCPIAYSRCACAVSTTLCVHAQ